MSVEAGPPVAAGPHGPPARRRRAPRALDGSTAARAAAGMAAPAVAAAPPRAALGAAGPPLAALSAHPLFGSGLPLLGCYPADRDALHRDLDAADADDVLDLR